MPLSQITTIKHEGFVDPNEHFAVLTTSGRRICGVTRDNGTREKRFYLVRKHWPAAIKRAADELALVRGRRGQERSLHNVQAIVDSNHGLIVGQTIKVFVFYGSHEDRSLSITLRGTITGFELEDKA